MWLTIRRLFTARVVRALMVGAIAALVQTAVFELLYTISHFTSASTAVVLSAEFGILTNFYLNNRFSFKDRKGEDTFNRLVRFHVVMIGAVFIQWVCLLATERQTSNLIAIHIAYLVSLVLGFIWNYTCYTTWVWRKSAPVNSAR